MAGGTVQLDFSMPERFGLEYMGSDDKKHTPVMIHRAVLGSIERFRHHDRTLRGQVPVWLAPEQVKIIPINDSHKDYANTTTARSRPKACEWLDSRNERLNFKIREAQMEQVPFMVDGDKEVESKTLGSRRVNGDQMIL